MYNINKCIVFAYFIKKYRKEMQKMLIKRSNIEQLLDTKGG